MTRKLLIFCLFIPFVQAGNVYTAQSHEISRIYFYSKQESIYPEWQGLTQVTFDNINWSSGSCDSRHVAIREEDDHILSALLTAKATGVKIRLYADDSIKVKNDYCFLRAISY